MTYTWLDKVAVITGAAGTMTEEFAHVVRFLASPLVAGFITCEIVDLNGGLVMD